MARRGERGSSHFNASQVIRNVGSARLVAKDPRIQRALELLPQVRAAQISDVAKALNLSASRFRHLFKEELGVSPRYYLRRARLERARELLGNSFLRVKEVAALVGVNDMSHFVRDYKALYNQTPSQSRTLSSKLRRQIPADSRCGQ